MENLSSIVEKLDLFGIQIPEYLTKIAQDYTSYKNGFCSDCGYCDCKDCDCGDCDCDCADCR